MSIIFYILGNNIFPIFTIIVLGFALSKKFDLQLFTLSKINFYLIIPSFVFVNLYTTNLDSSMLKVLLFSILYLVGNGLLAQLIGKIRKYDIGMINAFKNSIMFNNTGNIGLSLVTLVFSSYPFLINGQTPYLEEATATMIMIMVFNNITTNTLGFYHAGRATMDLKQSLQQIFTMPAIYVIPLALFLKYAQVDVTTTFVWPALNYLKDALVPMALLTLGVQLSKTQFNFKNKEVYISVFTRTIIGPIIAVLYIYLFKFTGVVAQTVLIGHSVPTAVNTALIAVECNNHQDFAAQVVMVSTIASAITLTLVIYLARILFPV